MEYVASVAGWDRDVFSGWTRFLSLATITIVLALLNYTGLEIVGKSSLTICIVAMSPFVIMIILGAPKVVPSRWFQMPETSEDASYALFDDDFQTSPGPLPLLTLGGILWRPWLSNMFWSLGSYDSAASFAGETAPGSTTYLKGIFFGLIMTVVAYIVPLLVAVGATDYSQAEWVDGHLANVAVDIGGKWLGVWTVFAAGINNVALFEAEMSSDAFKIMGMGKSFCPAVTFYTSVSITNAFFQLIISRTWLPSKNICFEIEVWHSKSRHHIEHDCDNCIQLRQLRPIVGAT
jgi:amino acid transporter